MRVLIYPGFLVDTWSSIEQRYLWLDEPLNQEGRCLWLVPPTGSRTAPSAKSENRGQKPVYVEALEASGASIVEFEVHRFNFLQNVRGLSRIVRDHRIDLVYTHFGTLRYQVELIARMLGVRVP